VILLVRHVTVYLQANVLLAIKAIFYQVTIIADTYVLVVLFLIHLLLNVMLVILNAHSALMVQAMAVLLV
jgi:hypothetical protein